MVICNTEEMAIIKNKMPAPIISHGFLGGSWDITLLFFGLYWLEFHVLGHLLHFFFNVYINTESISGFICQESCLCYTHVGAVELL